MITNNKNSADKIVFFYKHREYNEFKKKRENEKQFNQENNKIVSCFIIDCN